MKRFPHGKINASIITLITSLLILFGVRMLYTATNKLLSTALYFGGLLAMFLLYAIRANKLMSEVIADLEKTNLHFPKEGRGTQRLLIWFLLFIMPFVFGFIAPSDEAWSRFTLGRITGYFLGEMYHIVISRLYERRTGSELYYELRGRDWVILRRFPGKCKDDDEPIPR